MKKAYELSVLCDCEIALIIFTSNNKLYQYASSDMDKVLLKYTEYNDSVVSQTNKDIVDMLSKKESKGGADGDDDDDYPISPRTDEKYQRINAEFARAMNAGEVKTTPIQYQLPVQVPSSQYSSTPASMSGGGSVIVLQPPPGHGAHSLTSASAGSRITPSPSASVVSSQQLPQSQGIGQPVPIALHHAGDIQTSVTVSSNNSQPISVPTTSVKKPGLKVVIPERPPAVGQNRNQPGTALDTPNVSIATPNQGVGGQHGAIQAILSSASFSGDLLNSADIAGLSPLVYQLSSGTGPGPLTAALQASGVTFTPGGTMSLTGTPTISIPVQQQKSNQVKQEPGSPAKSDQHGAAVTPPPNQPSPAPPGGGDGEPAEKVRRLDTDG